MSHLLFTQVESRSRCWSNWPNFLALITGAGKWTLRIFHSFVVKYVWLSLLNKEKRKITVQCRMHTIRSACTTMNHYWEVLFHKKTLSSIIFSVTDSHICLSVRSTGRKIPLFDLGFSPEAELEYPKQNTPFAGKTNSSNGTHVTLQGNQPTNPGHVASWRDQHESLWNLAKLCNILQKCEEWWKYTLFRLHKMLIQELKHIIG